MDKKQIEKNISKYFLIAVPTAGFIVTLILLIYFVGINNQHSFIALLYCLIPLLVNILIASTFKILKRRYGKND